jgi:hypothetical protein
LGTTRLHDGQYETRESQGAYQKLSVPATTTVLSGVVVFP